MCTGFVYALAAGAGLITSGVADRVLVVGADVYSRIVDPADRQNAVVFGDGAGAVVLRAGYADESGALGSFDLGSDGEHEDMITVAAGGSRPTAGPGRTSHAERHFAMRGKEVYRHALNRMTESARTALDRSGLNVADVDRSGWRPRTCAGGPTTGRTRSTTGCACARCTTSFSTGASWAWVRTAASWSPSASSAAARPADDEHRCRLGERGAGIVSGAEDAYIVDKNRRDAPVLGHGLPLVAGQDGRHRTADEGSRDVGPLGHPLTRPS